MQGIFRTEGNRLIYEYDSEKLWIEPWGANSLRVRATHRSEMSTDLWALLTPEDLPADIRIDEDSASIKNGNIRADITAGGKLIFYNQRNEAVLEEYVRNRNDLKQFCSALMIDAREFKPIPGGDYALKLRFESDPDERIYGMGQYQHPYLNLKNCTLELAQRNSQASVPFALSSKGYGFLWNNPAIGRVTFGKNLTEWEAYSTKQLDYWITVGDTPAQIVESYASVTGTVPMMPEYGLGFWQSKLRYQTQDELLSVAREYKRRGLPIDVIVIDFFHWPCQGEWKFDPEYWPDPEGMVRELREMGIELMVSIWPTVDKTSENYPEMLRKGYLVRTDRGIRTTMDFLGNTVFFDATNPAARRYVWNIVKRNYYDKGIRIFWLDEAEPEYSVYDFDNYRYHLGPHLQVGNYYPVQYAQTFYEGMKEAGQEKIVNLVRCAWAGSQRFGALVWSGDIDSSFASMRNQLQAGLNMGLAGIPWWTTDIGGFHRGNPEDPDFRECIIRWFQFGAFCPVFRLHGDREPANEPLGTKGGGLCRSGAANEVWSYGEEAYRIFVKYMNLRERLRPYIRSLMEAAHTRGTPVIRPMFYDFPSDPLSWEVEDQYMFGPDYLVAPILEHGVRTRRLYLPAGAEWTNSLTGQSLAGGQWVEAEAPLDHMPLFARNGADHHLKP